MQPQAGFPIDGRVLPWGTTLDAACRLLGVAPGHRRHIASEALLPCSAVFGFPAISALLSAPAPELPVLSVAYELASGGEIRPDPEPWAATLTQQLGTPSQLARSEIPDYADPADCVPFYANWNLGDTGVGLSIYGALRTVEDGRSAGTLWLSWSEALAARPYLEAWRARTAQLAAVATRAEALQRFTVDYPLHGYALTGDGPRAQAARAAHLSLHRPALLDTPAAIAGRLDARSFALWRSTADGLWCASTKWDSVAHRLGEPVRVTWIELQPAKGPGHSGLAVEGWSVQAAHGSRGIRDAAYWLSQLPGVSIKQETGYDC